MERIDFLVQNGVIDSTEKEAVAREVQSGNSLEEILLSRGVDKAVYLETLSKYYGVPGKDVANHTIPFEVSEHVPEKSVEYYQFIPLEITDGVLEVGFVDPDNLEARDAVQFIASKSGMPYRIVLITEGDFKKLKESYGGLSGEVGSALSELETELAAEAEKKQKKEKEEDEDDQEKIVEDAPVTKIVATMLQHAVEERASDIHIEPMDELVRVRFRVDGVLVPSLELPIKVLSAVVARIKILSNMKLDEKRKPQDGRFSTHIKDRRIDFRVSTFPTYYGEKVVMRILDPDRGVIELDKMGMTERNLRLLREAIDRPYGLILISGPTGSGKTTTLYSMLKEVDRDSQNVLSLEDPVEYNIPGMNQSQVHPEIGYTFANGLRTTLRQDPDVIMVGEIRDKETAGLAIQAALTGHLVLSTIHTNNAVGVVPRLIDMGVDPYLIAPTLIVAVAQRLVKTLCSGGGKPIPVEGSIRAIIDKEFADLPEEYRSQIAIPEQVYTAEPTKDCPTGTRGRAAVFEVMAMDREVEQVILKEPNEVALTEISRQKGMLTLREDALLKAFEGSVPWEEVNKL